MKDRSPTVPDKTTIARELSAAFLRVREELQSLSETAYLQKPGDRWSPAEQLEHLILSSIPIVGALGKDRDWFDQFGPPSHPDKGHKALASHYKFVLSTGLKAPSRFVPESGKVYDIDQQLKSWKRLEDGIISRMDGWTEYELDRCILPHPALENLTMRQMLQFTTIHTYHHLSAITG
ncbi:DinB family protein [Flavilitoribacter nigricans]|uniref:DinB-like domain-containing protein n=1 Tax=Flavilitoribacter nigricans (strain ATCC 23147 / DSM 23189 / NBRC 102662 / NCIMB 1420 / SS-2) TaxID=1122177 RepID=A0A2D0NEL6_FLAN2|nr:DinB family protein [Flavilitoribacter nigricans]PHN06915.1 hypothetical protein CRP01_08850 [Flavilitoribacter nigricans DSM 23189 = NBRC 102662]